MGQTSLAHSSFPLAEGSEILGSCSGTVRCRSLCRALGVVVCCFQPSSRGLFYSIHNTSHSKLVLLLGYSICLTSFVKCRPLLGVQPSAPPGGGPSAAALITTPLQHLSPFHTETFVETKRSHFPALAAPVHTVSRTRLPGGPCVRGITQTGLPSLLSVCFLTGHDVLKGHRVQAGVRASSPLKAESQPFVCRPRFVCSST